jgi:hypothetical protein
LRKDKEERRRERVVAHLIEAYRNLENAAGRDVLSDEQKDRVETSVAGAFATNAGKLENARVCFSAVAPRVAMPREAVAILCEWRRL